MSEQPSSMINVPYDNMMAERDIQIDFSGSVAASHVPDNVESAIRRLFESELLPLYRRKSSGYGTGQDPLANLRRRGLLGIVVRMEDKMFRLGSLVEGAAEYDERMEDTLMDMVMYAMYAILMQRGEV